MRIHGVPPAPPSPPPPAPATAGGAAVGNAGQSFGTAAAQAAGTQTAAPPVEGKGPGGGGHAKKTAAEDPIRQATAKATVTTERAKVDERRQEIERLRTLARELFEKVRERDAKRRTGGVDQTVAIFHAFARATAAAFFAKRIGVQRLELEDTRATLSVFVTQPLRADTLTLLLWAQGDESKITVLLDRADGPTGWEREILPPFNEAKAGDLASDAIGALRVPAAR